MQRTLNLTLRPKSFDEMIGNEEAVTSIKTLLAKGTIPVAFMFIGPFGTGKTTLARIVAREVQGFEFPADMEPEILEINAANETGVDFARELSEAAQYRPLYSKYKVIILDEAHKLSNGAQNVLLKEWEKVDSATLWIVCTTESKKILKGLKDRAYTIPLKAATPEDRIKLIDRAAGTVEPPIPAESLDAFKKAAAEAGLNSPRDILMSFERFSNGMSPDKAVLVEEVDPQNFEIVRAACSGNWPEAARLLAQLNLALDKELRSEEEGVEKMDTLGESKLTAAITLRGIAAGYLRSMLVGNPTTKKGPATGARAEAITKALVSLRNFAWQPQDAATAFPMTCAALYQIATALKS